jgi:hypothetical protein
MNLEACVNCPTCDKSINSNSFKLHQIRCGKEKKPEPDVDSKVQSPSEQENKKIDLPSLDSSQVSWENIFPVNSKNGQLESSKAQEMKGISPRYPVLDPFEFKTLSLPPYDLVQQPLIFKPEIKSHGPIVFTPESQSQQPLIFRPNN